MADASPAPPSPDALARLLAERLPADRIAAGKAERLCYAYDATQLSALPDCVVFAQSAQEVSEVLRLANAHGFPVVPRGGGTGFVGGSVPVRGGVVLSLERMNRMVEIDRTDMLAIVEPGVVTAELHRAVEAQGLFYPPDPTSAASCTIGGNVASGATGPRSVKYGGTKDYVLALDAVLPTGEVVENPSRAVKRVAGYDLARLLVGTEGTLGVVTRITLRLLPLPEAVRTLLCAFPTVEAAARAVAGAIAGGPPPRTCEFMDHRCLDILRSQGKVDVPEAARAVLILETDGTPEAAEREARALSDLCRKEGAVEVREARTAEEVRGLWAARKALSQAMYEVGPTKINEDVVVPRSRLRELVAAVDSLAGKYDLPIVSFGHAGEGNLHVNVMVDRADAARHARAEAAVRELFEAVVALNGSVSGEHGIGVTKAPYLAIEVGAPGIEVMRRIKAAFDPRGILNPGKILP